MGAGAEATAVEEARDGSSGSILGRRTSEPEGFSATEAEATPTQLEGSASAAAEALGGSGTLGTLPAAAAAAPANSTSVAGDEVAGLAGWTWRSTGSQPFETALGETASREEYTAGLPPQ